MTHLMRPQGPDDFLKPDTTSWQLGIAAAELAVASRHDRDSNTLLPFYMFKWLANLANLALENAYKSLAGTGCGH